MGKGKYKDTQKLSFHADTPSFLLNLKGLSAGPSLEDKLGSNHTDGDNLDDIQEPNDDELPQFELGKGVTKAEANQHLGIEEEPETKHNDIPSKPTKIISSFKSKSKQKVAKKTDHDSTPKSVSLKSLKNKKLLSFDDD